MSSAIDQQTPATVFKNGGNSQTTTSDPLKGSTPQLVPEPVLDIKVPIPKTRQEVELLLAQYLNLSDTNKEDKQYKDKIEDVLFEISTKQAKISELEQTYDDHIIEDKESLDLSLLQKQITAFQLLSHDINLPKSLQEVFIQDEEEQEEGAEEEQEGEDKLASVQGKDFMSKAQSLGIDDSHLIHKTNDAAGNPYVEDIISSKISNRIRHLEKIPAELGSYDLSNLQNAFVNSDTPLDGIDDLKIKALIELKSLNLLPRQKFYRRKVVEEMIAKSHFDVDYLAQNPIIRSQQRVLNLKPKVFAIQTARLAKELEAQQTREQKKKETRAHLAKVDKIIEFADDFLNTREDLFLRKSNFGKSLQFLHQKIEKDESKRLESNAKQRLQALKANDEEAYLKLLDQTKDTRITHLLRQTNSFLDSLASAVKAQQNEAARAQSNTTAAAVVPAELQDQEREKIDYYEVAHRIKEEVVKQPSILVGGSLKEYQLKGLQWMVSLYNNHLNGILADEMGLGKTIQSISLVTYLYEVKQERGKFLVIVPLSTITNWTLEFEKWAPSLKTIVYKGSPPVRKNLQHEIRQGNFTVLLTTYEYIIKDRPLLAKFRWAHMIIDEGHRMKNSKSKLSYTLSQYYHTKNRLILTGTPLQNNLPELWALLNFVLPKIFNSVKSFDEWFNTPFANTGSQDKMELTEEESLLIIRRLHKVLRPFLLRRLKKDVEKDLPDKVEKVVKCKLSALQYAIYQQMLQHNALFVGQGAEGASKSGIKGLNNKIMQLRKICNHPYVFEEVENVINPERVTNDSIWRSSGKFELLDRVLPKFKASGHRVLMFFQMTQVMDIMEDFLRYKDLKYLRLDGSTKADDRQDMLKEFNAPDSEYFAFLLSTRAGGLGLNLQTADTVIIFDTDWNPHQDLQAQDRAHRIGQKNEVRILRLISNDSVEEIILERAHQKLEIDGKVIQAGKFDNKSTAQEQEEFLRKLLEAEQSAPKEASEDDELEDEALNEILARNEDEKILFAKIDEERVASYGKKNRLMQESELPTVFTEDITIHLHQPTVELGRTREKKRVYYDDGLTEEQWLDAMDADDDSVDAAIQRKRQRAEKRRLAMEKRQKLANGEHGHDDGDDSEELETIETPPPSTPLADDEDAAVNDEDEEDEEQSASRRGRRNQPVVKRITVTNKGRGGRNSRRRDASASLEEDDEDEEILAESDDEPQEEAEENDQEYIAKGLELIEKLDEMVDEEDGHYLSGIFQVLPSKKLYPDYYQVIAKPISISVIKKNLKNKVYESWNEVRDEFLLMFSNAKVYNGDESVIFKDAEKMEKLVNDF